VAGSVGWAAADRAGRQAVLEGKVAEAVNDAEGFIQQDKLADALAQMQRAEGLLGESGPEALRARVRQAWADYEMLRELDAIRLRQAEGKEGQMFDVAGAEAQYAAAFRNYGIDAAAVEPAEGAARVRGSAIREALLAGLDGWMQVKPAEDPERAKLRAVADGADDDAWRRAFREAALTNDREKLKALAAQEEALAQPPAVLAWLGWVMRGAGLPNGAAAVLRRAQRRYPGDFWINYNLGNVLIFGPGPLQQHVEEAVGYFRAAVALRPRSAEAHSILGLAFFLKRDADEAMACYQRAIDLDPKFATAHGNRADALRLKGDLDGAIAGYREAIHLQPDLAGAHRQLGAVLFGQGKYGEAEAEWREAIRLQPDDAPAHLGLGILLGQQGKHTDAEAVYREGLRFHADDYTLHWQLGVALYKQGKVPETEHEFREAIRLLPRKASYRFPVVPGPREQAVYHWNVGMVLKQQGKWEEALTAFKEAIRLDPNYQLPHQDLALVLATCPEVTLRDPPRAVEAARRAVALAEQSSWAWQVLGWSYYRAGDWKASIAALEKSCALQESPKGGDTGQWFVLAMAHWQLGNKDTARQRYNQAAEMIEHYGAMEGVWQFYGEAAVLLDIPGLGRGFFSAERGDWDRAAADYAKAFEKAEPGDLAQWLRYAALLVQTGDAKGYRKLCQRMLDRYGLSKDLDEIAFLAHTCVLAPNSLPDAARVVELAEQRMALAKASSRHLEWSAQVLALAYYRAGAYEKAAPCLSDVPQTATGDEGGDPPWVVGNCLVLAMVHGRLNHAAEARQWLKRVPQWIRKKRGGQADERVPGATPYVNWGDWLAPLILQREAEAVMKELGPDQPADKNEQTPGAPNPGG
jgi:tetratricopeptide (TPR) repeat protein